MKADIIRRAEAISDDEQEEYDPFAEPGAPSTIKGKGKVSYDSPAVLGPEEDDIADSVVTLRVTGDGEDSGDEEDDEDEEEIQTPETMLELAYMRDLKVFDRDAATRKSKARADLRTQTGKASFLVRSDCLDVYKFTGWADEQIEGWKIMLERTVSSFPQGLKKTVSDFNAAWAEGEDDGKTCVHRQRERT